MIILINIGDVDDQYDKGIKFFLSVFAKHELKLSRANDVEEDDLDFYTLNKEYNFKCLIKGNPEPENVTWVICDGAGKQCKNYTRNNTSVSHFNKI